MHRATSVSVISRVLWIAVALSWSVGLLTHRSAEGHDVNNVYDWLSGGGIEVWPGASPDVDVHFASGEVNATRETSIKAAMNNWDDVSGATLTFTVGSDVGNYSFYEREDCSPLPTNSVHWDNSIPNATGFDGLTIICASPGQIVAFQVGFDADSGVTWHSDGTNPPPGELDLRSLARHEFGHATGGWLKASPNGHLNESSAQCPNTSARHTMCETITLGESWQRSTEEHDEDSFKAAY